NQCGIGADEGPLPDICAMLGDAVIVAGYGAGTDIGALADPRIADISKMIGLGAGLNFRLFHLNEITDVHILSQVCSRTQPRKRTDARTLANMRALKMREGADRRAVLDGDTGTENYIRLDCHIFSEFGVCR